MQIAAGIVLITIYALGVGWAAVRRARAFRAYLRAFMAAHSDELPYTEREKERFRQELEMGSVVWRFNAIARGVMFRAAAATDADDAPDPTLAKLASDADQSLGVLLSLGVLGLVVAVAALKLMR